MPLHRAPHPLLVLTSHILAVDALGGQGRVSRAGGRLGLCAPVTFVELLRLLFHSHFLFLLLLCGGMGVCTRISYVKRSMVNISIPYITCYD